MPMFASLSGGATYGPLVVDVELTPMVLYWHAAARVGARAVVGGGSDAVAFSLATGPRGQTVVIGSLASWSIVASAEGVIGAGPRRTTTLRLELGADRVLRSGWFGQGKPGTWDFWLPVLGVGLRWWGAGGVRGHAG